MRIPAHVLGASSSMSASSRWQYFFGSILCLVFPPFNSIKGVKKDSSFVLQTTSPPHLLLHPLLYHSSSSSSSSHILRLWRWSLSSSVSWNADHIKDNGRSRRKGSLGRTLEWRHHHFSWFDGERERQRSVEKVLLPVPSGGRLTQPLSLALLPPF